MTWKDWCRHVSSLQIALVLAVSARAGSPAVGSIAGSVNASLNGEPIRPDTLVFHGDRLRVEDGAVVAALGQGGRLVFGRDTQASFLRGARGIDVVLASGNVSIYAPSSGNPLRVRLCLLSIRPLAGFETLGDVAAVNGLAVVTAKKGALEVQGAGPALDVREGHTITLPLKTARVPQGAPSAGAGAPPKQGGTSSLSQWLGIGAGAGGAVLGALGLSHANGASDTANRALSASSAASSTATSALQAAEGATAAAAAAANAATAATAVAVEAAITARLAANAVGCDLNRFANSMGQPSPYTPFPGLSCGP
jgi:hypothetical protein